MDNSMLQEYMSPEDLEKWTTLESLRKIALDCGCKEPIAVEIYQNIVQALSSATPGDEVSTAITCNALVNLGGGMRKRKSAIDEAG